LEGDREVWNVLVVSLDIAVELIGEQGVHHRSIFHTPNEDHLKERHNVRRREEERMEKRVERREEAELYLSEFSSGCRLMDQMVVDTLERSDANTSRDQEEHLSGREDE
jgi:hypothetical protein